ncbi:MULTISPECIES: hypothetical protein [Bacillus]|uniref:hypothetical protein n=1 Tax=Bacillus TaxID=1386 RepID=UPI000B4AE162|nr:MULTISPECIES: hypothetical protein [Bacillus cereus group]MEC3193933.1 hypothetical protein [Bacillus cereus]QFQ28775.1 hypothetical protein DDE73_29635 [Bacillus thuringiensis]WIG15412.1 hypothetical protein QOM09_27500 [Bacillus thuringiensis]WJX08077.1 hypothetical protein QTA68_29715 [Bacillus cereus]HEF1900047.1 hypothetical protein [Bacillus cereus]
MKNILNETQTNIENFEQILVLFSSKIRKSLQNTPIQEREDLEQEITIKMFEKYDMIKNFNAPGFFEFIED